ncbi:MAG: hypothetical protein H7Y20_03170 [Bryobacteraceae bacterium]|nr:hypothetical protein [Bryobacteraceae bacterium]
MKPMSSFAASLLFVTPLFAAELRLQPQPVVVHEWGTFTSIASENGNPVQWAPLSGTADLPCFVASLVGNSGSATFKDRASGLVRMETPVLYFYSQTPAALSVRVGFPQGWITEWYPKATAVTPAFPRVAPTSGFTGGEIRWDDVRVMPGQNPELPISKNPSHYFAARNTDSAPLQVGKQWEKLIFYRGVGDFAVPLQPVLTKDGRVKITNNGTEAIPLMILFENRAGKVGYRLATGSKTAATELEFPELGSTVDQLRTALASHLVEFGLYRKEADAMIETWRDSWFEEGMRLFYIVPREMVDRVLPLDVQPVPSSTARVFVGRIELLSPAMRETIEAASAAGDTRKLEGLGRFLGPFVMQMERTSPGRERPAAVQALFSKPRPSSGSCVQ